jgi:hypothetical protein
MPHEQAKQVSSAQAQAGVLAAGVEQSHLHDNRESTLGSSAHRRARISDSAPLSSAACTASRQCATHQSRACIAVEHLLHQRHINAQALAVHQGGQLGVWVCCKGGGNHRGKVMRRDLIKVANQARS